MNINYALEMFSEYCRNKNYSMSTILRNCHAVKSFMFFCGKEDVREIAKEDILKYQKELHTCERYTKGSQRTMMASVKIFFKYLARNDKILVNPFDTIDMSMKRTDTKRESIDEKKLKDFLDGINGLTFFDIRDRAIFELIYGTGLRGKETTELNVTDIDYQSGKIFIHEGKGRKDRIVPVGNNALKHVKEYIESARSKLKKIKDRDSLFVTKDGLRMKVINIRYSFKRRFKVQNPLDNVYPHILRHSFATHMLEAGAGIKQIKDILGHNSIQTTVIYTHFNVKSMKKTLKMYHPRENELYEELKEEEIKKLFDNS